MFNFLPKIFLLVSFTFFLNSLQAQTEEEIAQWEKWEEKIALFESNNSDSLIFYHQKIAELTRANDLLYFWADNFVRLFENLQQKNLALIYLDSINGEKWREPTAEENEPFVLANLNKAYHIKQSGDIFEANRYYEKALRYYEMAPLEDFDVVGYIFQALGNNYTRLGDNKKARATFQKALNYIDENDPQNLCDLFSNIGISYWNQGDFQKAIDEYKKGLKVKSISQKRRGMLYSNIARSHFDMAQDSAAALFAGAALRSLNDVVIRDEQWLQWQAGALLTRGSLFAQQSDLTRALQYLQKAKEVAIEGFGKNNRAIAKIEIAIGNILKRGSDYEKAIENYNSALTTVLPLFTSKGFLENPSPNIFYEENTIFEALEAKADALLLFYKSQPLEQAGDKNRKWLEVALECHTLAYQVENLLRKTYQYDDSKLLLQTFSRTRTEKAIETAWLLFAETNDSKYAEQAFQFAEQSKSVVLLEAVKDNLARSEISIGDSLFLNENNLKKQLAFFEKQLLEQRTEGAQNTEQEKVIFFQKRKIEIEEQLTVAVRLIEEKYPAYKKLKYQYDQLTVHDIQQKILGATADVLVEYFLGEKNLFIFHINAKEFSFLKIERDRAYDDLVKNFLFWFESASTFQNNPEGYKKQAFELYKIIYQEVAPSSTENFSKVIIVPDDVISYIPFDALLTQPSEGTNLSKAPYLLRQQITRYAYSATVLLNQSGLSNKKGGVLAMAPVFEKKQRGLNPLTYSEKELKSLGFSNENLLLNENASLRNFRKDVISSKLIHLSTHAEVDSSGLPPRIEFSDSTFYLSELYNLNLQADLVVLSACKTGLGRLQKGEGVMSLARGFTYAGAASLISSLWTVNDASTSMLFADFYKNSKNNTKATALHEAKYAYLENPSIGSIKKSPYYWAGFIFIGNDGTLKLPNNNLSIERFLAIGALLLLIAALFLRKYFIKKSEARKTKRK